MKPQVKMLTEMIHVVRYVHGITMEQAYQIVLSYIAVRSNFEQQLATEGMKAEAFEKLDTLLDLDLLREEKRDWLGEAGELLGVFNFELLESPDSAYINVANKLAGLNVEGHMPVPILIEKAETGRRLIEAYKIAGDKVMLFSVEPDILLYRTAILNMHLHGIPSHILCADDTVDLSIGAQNWRQSNLWRPLKPIKYK